jgi:hypothetical protein
MARAQAGSLDAALAILAASLVAPKGDADVIPSFM